MISLDDLLLNLSFHYLLLIFFGNDSVRLNLFFSEDFHSCCLLRYLNYLIENFHLKLNLFFGNLLKNFIFEFEYVIGCPLLNYPEIQLFFNWFIYCYLHKFFNVKVLLGLSYFYLRCHIKVLASDQLNIINFLELLLC